MRHRRSIALAALVLMSASASVQAKPLGPGDTRVCDASGCDPIEDRRAVRALASFLYAGPQPERVPNPSLGERSFEIRLRGGRAVGVVSGKWLNRMRVPKLNCDRFSGRGWYRLPPELARELRALTAGREGIPVGPPPRRSC